MKTYRSNTEKDIISFWIKWICASIIFGILLLGSWFTVYNGERAILLTFGSPSDTVYTEGLHFKFPMIQSVERYDIKQQTISSTMSAASKDLQDVKIDITANYHVNYNSVLYLFRTYGPQDYFHNNVVSPISQEVLKSVSSQYTAEELVTQRINFSLAVEQRLNQMLEEKNVTLDKFNIVNLKFSDQFETAIEGKVTAQQNALAAKNKLEQIQFEANQTVAKAQGDKQSQILKAEADAESIKIVNQQLTSSPSYLEYYKLQKWNGVLPKATGSSNLISVNLDN